MVIERNDHSKRQRRKEGVDMSYVLQSWDPENPAQWQREGRRVASRNLWGSIAALFLAFCVWMVWSMVVINLPKVGFKFSTDQLFWLAALPGLSGATLRIFYAFMVPIFGGRRWTVFSTAMLLIPAVGIGYAVQDPTTPYSTMLVLSLLCGFGGGNFASSMANISFFFPKAQKGFALGMNAGLGNLGVSAMQLVVPFVITIPLFGGFGGGPQVWWRGGVETQLWLQNAGFIWAPLIVASSLFAWFKMNDVGVAKASLMDQFVIFRQRHTWVMSWLYLGTFGSFIGFSAGFPLLIRTQFPNVNVVAFAFLGPLVGALARVGGGWVSDKLCGACVTLGAFLVMACATVGVVLFLPHPGYAGNFWMFFLLFMILFVATGVGNASTFRMVPLIFLALKEQTVENGDSAQLQLARADANKESAAVLGFISAIAAYGAFFIPMSYGTSIKLTGAPDAALFSFVLFYLSCIVVTWQFYSRKGAKIRC